MSTSIDTGLIERVKELAALRERAADSAFRIKIVRECFEREHADLIASVRETAAIVAAAETALRAVALERYDITKERRPAPGVEIRLFKSYEIDESAGLEWAKEKSICLIPERLDVAAVKKMATVVPLPFVVVDEEPRVMIASDLGLVLAEYATDLTPREQTADA